MAPLDDRAGELQLGGGLPPDYFFHSVPADQPDNFHRPVPKSEERREPSECAETGVSVQG